MVIYSILRVIFYLFNQSLIGEPTWMMFIGGLRFDLSAITFLNTPYLLLSLLPFGFRSRKGYQQMLRILFVFTNAVGIGLACIDFQYFRFIGKRSTADLFDFVQTGGDLFRVLPEFALDYWYIILFFLFVLWALKKLFDLPAQPVNEPIFRPVQFGIDLLLFVLVIGLGVIAARGGLQLRPLSIPDATRYADAQGAAVVLNTPFTMIKSVGAAQLEPIDKFSQQELEAEYPVIKEYDNDSTVNRPNVVILILESFSKEFVGYYNPGKPSPTPRLDSILHQSLSYTYSYANGKKSMEAMPSILAGIPAWMQDPLITSPYANNRIKGLPEHLGEIGYSSTFFHGGNDGTMGFDAFAQKIGFDRYAGLSDYPYPEKDYDGTWGIFDDPFLQWSLDETSRMEKPFLSVIFTLSSHHPYRVPEKYEGRFKGFEDPVQKSIAYTDMAVGKFFEKAAKLPWFENTLFVITADHTPASNSYYFNNTTGIWEVPIAFYQPGKIEAEESQILIQHIDIMPSVLDKVGYQKPFFAFGEAPWRKKDPFGLNYMGNVYWYWDDDHLLKHTSREPLAFYQYRRDSLLKYDFSKEDALRVDSLSRELLIRLQRFRHAMIHNELIAR